MIFVRTVHQTQKPQALHRQCALTVTSIALTMAAALSPMPAAAVGRLGNLDIVSRSDGQVLPVYPGGGRHWVVGTPGQEYSIRFCNTSPGRVLAVMSVDGVNVISGDTASPAAVGLRAERLRVRRHQRLAQEHGAHRRVLLHRAARRLRDAHRPSGERRRDRRRRVPRAGAGDDLEAHRQDRERSPARRACVRVRAGLELRERSEAGGSGRGSQPTRKLPARRRHPRWRRSSAPATAAARTRPPQTVRFERESATPNETIAIHYDRRENLVAMGILPPPVVARTPNPFPAWPRFVPDPPNR